MQELNIRLQEDKDNKEIYLRLAAEATNREIRGAFLFLAKEKRGTECSQEANSSIERFKKAKNADEVLRIALEIEKEGRALSKKIKKKLSEMNEDVYRG